MRLMGLIGASGKTALIAQFLPLTQAAVLADFILAEARPLS